MNQKESSMTSLISSFSRAYHCEYDSPKIFSDTLARQLMTDEEFQQISGYMASGIDFFAPEKKGELNDSSQALKWVVQTQLAPTPLARARFCEDALANAIRLGVSQYVILGAGMDTYAYRNSNKEIKIFEVDHPSTQTFKKAKVQAADWAKPENLQYVSMDFSTDDLKTKLIDAGFDPSRLTFFSWLGVSYYLTEEQIIKMLKSISSLAPKGSSVVFDYADENLFSSTIKRVQNMVSMAKASGEPMKACFSYNKLEKSLEEANLLIYEHLNVEEIEQTYFSNRQDDLHAFEHISYVLAVVR